MWFKQRFHERASSDGECWFGKEYRKGQFLPFYVPRPVMPQIDEEDYAEFIEFAAESGHELVVRYRPPTVLRPHQRLDRFHADRMPPEVKRKFVYIDTDGFILDGNHRWMLHVRDRSVVPCFQLRLPFEDAIALMFAFPKTYSLNEQRERN